MKTEIGQGQRIGSKAAGLACLPNGDIRWGDHIQPAESQLIEIARDVIGKPASQTRDPDLAMFEIEQQSADFRIVATIKHAEMKICMPKWGLGQRDFVKGKGRLIVEWKVYSTAAKAIILTTTTDERWTPSTGSRGGTLGFFHEMLRATAIRFVETADSKLQPS